MNPSLEILAGQHHEVRRLTRALSTSAEECLNLQDAERIRSLLSELSGLLMVHFAMEDNHVYPKLLAHRDASTREIASRFKSEIGDLSDRFKVFRRLWSDPAKLLDERAAFRVECGKMFQLLNQRMTIEDRQLYPLLAAPR